MQEIERFTDGKLRVGAGTLYRSIKQMLTDGLIEESGERPDPTLDDERRRYYHLTESGKRTAQAEMGRLAELVAVAQRKRLIAGGG